MTLKITSEEFRNLNHNIGLIAGAINAVCMAGINNPDSVRESVLEEFIKQTKVINQACVSAQSCLHQILENHQQNE